MNHLHHLNLHKESLQLRWVVLKALRQFFWQRDFTEVETPMLLAVPGMEPYLDPMRVQIFDEKGMPQQGYLHTSPEYTLKKMLAAGSGNIYSLAKCFRNSESFGHDHNPEFTMLEWYREQADMWVLMDDIAALCNTLSNLPGAKSVQPPSRIHMNDLWQESIGISLNEYLTTESLRMLCQERGHDPAQNEPYEDLFFRIFLNEIEPLLAERGSVIVHHFPLPLAALACKSDAYQGYADRFEWYVNGKEIANAFTELTDDVEQRNRFKKEQDTRKFLHKTVFPIDEDFIEAVGALPHCAGIALGVDRLVMALSGCQNIDDVLPLPASIQFDT